MSRNLSDGLTIEDLATRYKEYPATVFFRSFPRFGHTNDIVKLFTSKEERTDYIYGLLFAGLFLFLIMLAWSIGIFVMKCVGKRRVGFLSGSPFEKREGKCSRPTVCRAIFMIATMIFVAFSILSVVQGLTKLFDTANTVVTGATMANNLATDVEGARTSFQDQVKTVIEYKDRVKAFTDSSPCFNENIPLPQTVTREQVADLSGKIENVTNQVNEVMDSVTSNVFNEEQTQELLNIIKQAASNFVKGDEPFWARALQEGDVLNEKLDSIEIEKPEEVSTSAEGDTDVPDVREITPTHWLSLIIYVPFVFTGCIFILFNGLAMCGIFNGVISCLANWFFLPLLALETFIAYVLSSLVLLVGAANGDFCSGGVQNTPDQTVIRLITLSLEKSNVEPTTAKFISEATTKYIRECVSGNPFDSLTNDFRDAQAALVAAQSILESASSPGAVVEEVCQTPSLFAIVGETLSALEDLLVHVGRAVGLFRCPNVSPIYQYPVYDGTCNYSVTGLTWAFASFLVVAAMGHIMFMLRSSLQREVEASSGTPLAKEMEQAADDEHDVEALDKGEVEEEVVVTAAAATEDRDPGQELEVQLPPSEDDEAGVKQSNNLYEGAATSPEDGIVNKDVAAGPSANEGSKDATELKAFDDLVASRLY